MTCDICFVIQERWMPSKYTKRVAKIVWHALKAKVLARHSRLHGAKSCQIKELFSPAVDVKESTIEMSHQEELV